MFQKKSNGSDTGMPTGIQMVVRSLFPNFNPEEFSAQIDDVRRKTAEVTADYTARLIRIEQKLDALVMLFADDSKETERIARESNERIGISSGS